MATLTLFMGGQEAVFTREIGYAPPRDQWMAILVDMDAGTWEFVDFFPDQGVFEPEDPMVVLSWDTDANLDLEIWSPQLEYLGDAHHFMAGPDVTSGLLGEEWFVFRDTSQYDFSQGSWIISAYFYDVGPSGQMWTNATITLYMGDHVEVFTSQVEYIPPNDQWMVVLVDMDAGSWELLDYFLDVDGDGLQKADLPGRGRISWLSVEEPGL